MAFTLYNIEAKNAPTTKEIRLIDCMSMAKNELFSNITQAIQ